MDSEFSRQAADIVRENQHLRVKSNNDDKTLHLMRQQYKALASSVEGMRDEHRREAHQLRTERDEAVAKHATIKSLLLQQAEITMQALRADAGNETPEKMPESRGQHITDDRLPLARLG